LCAVCLTCLRRGLVVAHARCVRAATAYLRGSGKPAAEPVEYAATRTLGM